eukprot:2949238-Rhodomonas_salina.2
MVLPDIRAHLDERPPLYVAHRSISLRICYAKSGTHIACGTHGLVLPCAYGAVYAFATRQFLVSRRQGRTEESEKVGCYAGSSTGIAYGALRYWAVCGVRYWIDG